MNGISEERKLKGWLTDDNIQHILRSKDFYAGVIGTFKNNYNKNILGNNILLITNTSSTYLAYHYSKIPAENRDGTQINVLEKFKKNWENESSEVTEPSLYTIFPITLGSHPGNHWGALIFSRIANFGLPYDPYDVYWVDSIGGYENQIKPLVTYLTNQTISDSIKVITPTSRQSNGWDCGVYLCLYIKEIIFEFESRRTTRSDVLALKKTITNDDLIRFRNEWSAKIGGDKWCKTGGATEDDFGGWDWGSVGILESQVDQWFYGTDKEIGKKGLLFEYARDLIFAGFKPEEGEFANWAWKEFRNKKAYELGVSINNELMDGITPFTFAQALNERHEEKLEEWRTKYQNKSSSNRDKILKNVVEKGLKVWDRTISFKFGVPAQNLRNKLKGWIQNINAFLDNETPFLEDSNLIKDIEDELIGENHGFKGSREGQQLKTLLGEWKKAVGFEPSKSTLVEPAVTLTASLTDQKYISTAGTIKINEWGSRTPLRLPRGSALLTGSGKLKKLGIKHIIHACPGSHSSDSESVASSINPTLEKLITSVQNSLLLAQKNNITSIAFPLIGGELFLNYFKELTGSEKDKKERLAEIIMVNAINQVLNDLSFGVITVVFVDFFSVFRVDELPFQKAYKRLKKEKIIWKDALDNVRVVEGNDSNKGITNYDNHKCEAIVNAANLECQFGGGISGKIGEATESIEIIDKEAKEKIEQFWNISKTNANSLAELLDQYATRSGTTKKIELDNDFLKVAEHKWPNQTLDFSKYVEVEEIKILPVSTLFEIPVYPFGKISKINLDKNTKLRELIFPQNELQGTLDLSANKNLEVVDLTNNRLDELVINDHLYNQPKHNLSLTPQRHDKKKIDIDKDVKIKMDTGREGLENKKQQLQKEIEGILNTYRIRWNDFNFEYEYNKNGGVLGRKHWGGLKGNDWKEYLATIDNEITDASHPNYGTSYQAIRGGLTIAFLEVLIPEFFKRFKMKPPQITVKEIKEFRNKHNYAGYFEHNIYPEISSKFTPGKVIDDLKDEEYSDKIGKIAFQLEKAPQYVESAAERGSIDFSRYVRLTLKPLTLKKENVDKILEDYNYVGLRIWMYARDLEEDNKILNNYNALRSAFENDWTEKFAIEIKVIDNKAVTIEEIEGGQFVIDIYNDNSRQTYNEIIFVPIKTEDLTDNLVRFRIDKVNNTKGGSFFNNSFFRSIAITVEPNTLEEKKLPKRIKEKIIPIGQTLNWITAFRLWIHSNTQEDDEEYEEEFNKLVEKLKIGENITIEIEDATSIESQSTGHIELYYTHDKESFLPKKVRVSKFSEEVDRYITEIERWAEIFNNNIKPDLAKINQEINNSYGSEIDWKITLKGQEINLVKDNLLTHFQNFKNLKTSEFGKEGLKEKASILQSFISGLKNTQEAGSDPNHTVELKKDLEALIVTKENIVGNLKNNQQVADEHLPEIKKLFDKYHLNFEFDLSGLPKILLKNLLNREILKENLLKWEDNDYPYPDHIENKPLKKITQLLKQISDKLKTLGDEAKLLNGLVRKKTFKTLYGYVFLPAGNLVTREAKTLSDWFKKYRTQTKKSDTELENELVQFISQFWQMFYFRFKIQIPPLTWMFFDNKEIKEFDPNIMSLNEEGEIEAVPPNTPLLCSFPATGRNLDNQESRHKNTSAKMFLLPLVTQSFTFKTDKIVFPNEERVIKIEIMKGIDFEKGTSLRCNEFSIPDSARIKFFTIDYTEINEMTQYDYGRLRKKLENKTEVIDKEITFPLIQGEGEGYKIVKDGDGSDEIRINWDRVGEYTLKKTVLTVNDYCRHLITELTRWEDLTEKIKYKGIGGEEGNIGEILVKSADEVKEALKTIKEDKTKNNFDKSILKINALIDKYEPLTRTSLGSRSQWLKNTDNSNLFVNLKGNLVSLEEKIDYKPDIKEDGTLVFKPTDVFHDSTETYRSLSFEFEVGKIIAKFADGRALKNYVDKNELRKRSGLRVLTKTDKIKHESLLEKLRNHDQTTFVTLNVTKISNLRTQTEGTKRILWIDLDALNKANPMLIETKKTLNEKGKLVFKAVDIEFKDSDPKKLWILFSFPVGGLTAIGFSPDETEVVSKMNSLELSKKTGLGIFFGSIRTSYDDTREWVKDKKGRKLSINIIKILKLLGEPADPIVALKEQIVLDFRAWNNINFILIGATELINLWEETVGSNKEKTLKEFLNDLRSKKWEGLLIEWAGSGQKDEKVEKIIQEFNLLKNENDDSENRWRDLTGHQQIVEDTIQLINKSIQAYKNREEEAQEFLKQLNEKTNFNKNLKKLKEKGIENSQIKDFVNHGLKLQSLITTKPDKAEGYFKNMIITYTTPWKEVFEAKKIVRKRIKETMRGDASEPDNKVITDKELDKELKKIVPWHLELEKKLKEDILSFIVNGKSIDGWDNYWNNMRKSIQEISNYKEWLNNFSHGWFQELTTSFAGDREKGKRSNKIANELAKLL